MYSYACCKQRYKPIFSVDVKLITFFANSYTSECMFLRQMFHSKAAFLLLRFFLSQTDFEFQWSWLASIGLLKQKFDYGAKYNIGASVSRNNIFSSCSSCAESDLPTSEKSEHESEQQKHDFRHIRSEWTRYLDEKISKLELAANGSDLRTASCHHDHLISDSAVKTAISLAYTY